MLIELVLPTRRIRIMEGDIPPDRLPLRDIVLAREDGEDWAVGFMCPCGCGNKLELLLVKEASPNWKLVVDARSKPTLYPCVVEDWLSIAFLGKKWEGSLV